VKKEEAKNTLVVLEKQAEEKTQIVKRDILEK